MVRRSVAGLVLWVMLALPVAAQPVDDQIRAALVAQGYAIVSMERTWLGRLRVVAENGEIRREIVVHMSTGEVLRDYSVAIAADDTATRHASRQSERQDRDDTPATTATGASETPSSDAAPQQALEGVMEGLPLVVAE